MHACVHACVYEDVLPDLELTYKAELAAQASASAGQAVMGEDSALSLMDTQEVIIPDAEGDGRDSESTRHGSFKGFCSRIGGTLQAK